MDMWRFDVQRGVYFEITYSDLITDVQARRQMISNAKVRIAKFLYR
jgi:ribonuclease P/MRP protein subunit RPP1